MHIHTLAALVVLLAAPSSIAAVPGGSLIENGSFDVDLAGWVNVGPVAYWSTDDADMDPSSGSAWMRNESLTAGDNKFLRQCVPISAPGRYDAGVETAFSGNQQRTGRVWFSLAFWDQPDCFSGNVVGFVPSEDAAPSSLYEPLMLLGVEAPPGAQGVALQLTLTKTESGGVFEAYLDNAFLPEPAAGTSGGLAVVVVALLRRARQRREPRAMPPVAHRP